MRQYGLIGFPLKHSFSQNYFHHKFLNEGITDAEFLNFSIAKISEVETIFDEHPFLKGLAVTIPHKKAILEYIDEISDEVKWTGACNCVQITSGKKAGYNTDITGFETSFKKNLQPYHKKALILGTGGAAAAVEYVLRKNQIGYAFISRTPAKDMFTWDQIDEKLLDEFKVIINCTPLGTYPNTAEKPNMPYHFLTPRHYLFDLVYNPPQTQFLLEGEKHGCYVQNGYEMLVIQAEENWKIWNS